LTGYAIGLEKGGLIGGEEGLSFTLAFGVEIDGFIVESVECFLKFVMFHSKNLSETQDSGKSKWGGGLLK
jgi:hypothetical protein